LIFPYSPPSSISLRKPRQSAQTSTKMCVRTKTSYGCGCAYKSTNECGSSRCSGLERYHYMHEGDCRACKSGGDAVTRGREGMGRYAQEINRRSPPIDIPYSTGPRMDEVGSVSPWSSSARRGDEWHSPTRMQADDAWEREHETRMSDLQSRTERMSISAPTSNPRPPRRSPSYEVEEISDQYHSQDEEYPSRQKAIAPRSLFGEVKITRELRHSPRTPSFVGGRHDSSDSLGSLPKLRHSPRTYSYETRDPYDSGYGSYDSYDLPKSRRRAHGARTEPYLYSSHSERQVQEIPVSAAAYGFPSGTYGVEIHPSARYLSQW
jgi:hypothetical protein